MIGPMSAISGELSQTITNEIEKIKRGIKENKGALAEKYTEFRHRFQAKSAKVMKEKNELDQMFKDFVKDQEAAGRAALMQSPDFYLDSLNKLNHVNVLAALDDQIQVWKRETEDSSKIELDSIKNFQEFMGSPHQHFK